MNIVDKEYIYKPFPKEIISDEIYLKSSDMDSFDFLKDFIKNHYKEILSSGSILCVLTTDETLKDFLKQNIVNTQNGIESNYDIFIKNNIYIGGIKIRKIKKDRLIASYFLNKKYQGKGLASKAFQLLENKITEEHIARSIFLTIYINNQKSINFAKRNKFELIDTIEGSMISDTLIFEKILNQK